MSPTNTTPIHTELAPELASFLGEIDGIGPVLKAPLVFMVPYLPAFAALANRSYRAKTQAVHRAETEGDWQKVLWLYEKPYRLSVFLGVCDRMSDRDYWQTLASLWIETENLHEQQDVWLLALTAARRGRARWLMNDGDRAVLAALDEQVTVHRGFRLPGRHLAPSWTLSRARAEWFACRALARGVQGRVATVTVPKASVIACFTQRNEQEIVLDPLTLTAGAIAVEKVGASATSRTRRGVRRERPS